MGNTPLTVIYAIVRVIRTTGLTWVKGGLSGLAFLVLSDLFERDCYDIFTINDDLLTEYERIKKIKFETSTSTGFLYF